MERRFRAEEPFGKPDGSSDDISHTRGSVVTFPPRFGGISRDPSDAKVRVVVGQLGAGKSLQLRRMQDHIAQAREGSKVAFKVEASSELTTESILKFAQVLELEGGNTEDWKIVWRRAIIRSAVSHLLFAGAFKEVLSEATRSNLTDYVRMLGNPRTPHKVTQEIQTIVQSHHSPDALRKYLHDPRWPDVEHFLSQALDETLGLFLYVDDVDKNFRWAPSLWIQCQRGLFYAVMDLLRDEDLRNKFHIVIALRDIAFSTIRVSEQASRYLDQTHINILSWNRSSMLYLLAKKLKSLPGEYFDDPKNRTIQSWLGRSTIHNSRRNPQIEPLDLYLVRHTNLVPRDLVRMGNLLCSEIRALNGSKPSEERIRAIVSAAAAEAALRQVAQCANQVLSDIIPPDAFAKEYDHAYIKPNLYALASARDNVLNCIGLSATEIFQKERLDEMDENARELFGADRKVNLCDALWQQGLLGYIDGRGDGHFYRLESIDGASVKLSRRPGLQGYIWNPLVFDLQIDIQSNLDAPVWPE